ncbi:hypothetical protein BV22DRAFT_1188297 [Leucogyrophana mollusca]|uniref:Uncharacterized protein n=1 Tax=Leucogyrophana mollusca TaxID=85980 RepID=A0ACB8AVU1_9AGAM|nr:hypothetical protein BV22DRAFT_1188297 [Leucogyrophana mollusca]
MSVDAAHVLGDPTGHPNVPANEAPPSTLLYHHPRVSTRAAKIIRVPRDSSGGSVRGCYPFRVTAHIFTLIYYKYLQNLIYKTHFVSVGYPVILGLDWLCQHNPNIDWEDSTLSLECCGLSRTNPIAVVAKGFGLKPAVSRSTLNSVTSVGLGFGLSDATSTAISALALPTARSDTPSTLGTTPDPSPIPPRSFLITLVQWTVFGRSSPSLPPLPLLNI